MQLETVLLVPEQQADHVGASVARDYPPEFRLPPPPLPCFPLHRHRHRHTDTQTQTRHCAPQHKPNQPQTLRLCVCGEQKDPCSELTAEECKSVVGGGGSVWGERADGSNLANVSPLHSPT
eukprot:2447893-Rhodomonas_salina.2